MSAEVVSLLAAALGGFLLGWQPRYTARTPRPSENACLAGRGDRRLA